MYGIMRTEKRGRASIYGLQIEANRSIADHAKGRDFDNSDIDWEKTNENYFFKKTENWNTTITQLLHKCDIKPRKDSILLLDTLYTASPAFFEGKSREFILQYFKDCLDWHSRRFGVVLNAVVHFDEATPHLAIASVPLFKKDGQFHLSAKTIMGGRGAYQRRQDLFHEEVSKKYGLERGERRDPAERKKHIQKREWQNQQLQKQYQALTSLNDKLKQEVFEKLEVELMDSFIQNYEVNGSSGRKKPIKDFYERFLDEHFQSLRQMSTQPSQQQILDEFSQYIQDSWSHERE